MAQALLVSTDDNLRTILKLNLMKTLGVEVIEKKSEVDAVALLDILPSIDLVISEATVIREFNHLTIPVISISKNDWKETVSAVAHLLAMTPAWDDNLMSEEYVSVPVLYFLNISHTSMGCDVYIRVKKAEGLFQYVKRLHSYDSFKREDIEKYISQGLKEFFITKEHFSTFVNFVTGQMVLKLDEVSLHGKERIQLTAESYEVTKERIHSIGVDDYTVEIVQESIKSMQSSIKEGSAISDFLQMLQGNQLSYQYSHSYLCCLILHEIIKHFDWATPQIKEKLTYLAYFHDMSLKEDHLIRINNLQDFNASTFKLDERDKVLNHALESAKLVDRFSELPTGLSALIKEHHGVKSGMGFPDFLSTTINSVSMMFMVVEHFVDEFLKVQGTPTHQQLRAIFDKMRELYNKSTYAQTLFELERLALQ